MWGFYDAMFVSHTDGSNERWVSTQNITYAFLALKGELGTTLVKHTHAHWAWGEEDRALD